MQYSRSKIEIMQHLGAGLSVDSLCKKCEITYDQLCELAKEHTDLYHELKKWYKRYDFMPTSKSLETKEITEDNPKKTKKKVV